MGRIGSALQLVTRKVNAGSKKDFPAFGEKYVCTRILMKMYSEPLKYAPSPYKGPVESILNFV